MATKKILIVDDDPDIRDVITIILQSADYDISAVSNGQECLNKIKQEKPDLLILDLLMPILDGFAVYKELQNPEWSSHKDMPILVITSVREEASRRRYELETGQKLNVDSYIEKPIAPDLLIETVGKLIKRKEGTKE